MVRNIDVNGRPKLPTPLGLAHEEVEVDKSKLKINKAAEPIGGERMELNSKQLSSESVIHSSKFVMLEVKE